MNHYWSQKLIFELKPGMKLYSENYFKTEGKVINTGNNGYRYKNEDRTKHLSIEPEIYLDFYQINKKWQLGVGLTTFNWDNKIYIRSSGYSFIADSTSTQIFQEHVFKNTHLRYTQFSGVITRTFRTSTFLDRFILNKLILGVGINKPSMFNPKYNMEKYYFSVMDNNQGYVTSQTYTKDKIFGHCSPYIQLKYELVIMNKHHDFGIFNLNISYIQGFQNQYQYSMSSSNYDGASIFVSTKFKASGLRIGISKTFSFNKKKKSI
jgi:hypothetical protein